MGIATITVTVLVLCCCFGNKKCNLMEGHLTWDKIFISPSHRWKRFQTILQAFKGWKLILRYALYQMETVIWRSIRCMHTCVCVCMRSLGRTGICMHGWVVRMCGVHYDMSWANVSILKGHVLWRLVTDMYMLWCVKSCEGCVKGFDIIQNTTRAVSIM